MYLTLWMMIIMTHYVSATTAREDYDAVEGGIVCETRKETDLWGCCNSIGNLCDVEGIDQGQEPVNGDILVYNGNSIPPRWEYTAPQNVTVPCTQPCVNGTKGADGTNGTNATCSSCPSSPIRYALLQTQTPHTVAPNADVQWITPNLQTSGGIITISAQPPADTQVEFITAGTYSVQWIITATEPNQFSIFINGFQQNTASTFGSGAGTQQNQGHSIVTIVAGDILTLRNYLSAAGVGLQSLAGGTVLNTVASMYIMQLSS